MLAPLPDHIDVLRLARQGSKLAGSQSLERMTRLRLSVLLQDDIIKPVLEDGQQEHQGIGFANIELEFGEDNERIMFIKGKVQGSVYMMCQRCLEPMLVKLNTVFLLGVVGDEARVDRLPNQYEPLVISDKSSSLSGIIEDELILSLPLVALHEVDQCPTSALLLDMALASEKERDAGQEDRKLKNPFSVLSTLKKEVK